MKRGKFIAILLPLLTLFLFPKLADAETKTLNSTKDTYVNSGSAYVDRSYGSVAALTISNKYVERLGYLQFGNLDLPENATIDRAYLNLYLYELHYSDRAKLNVGPVTGDWEENEPTWNNKPTINQTLASEVEIQLDEPGWKEINITDLARRWHEGTSENKGVFIYPYGHLYGTAETEYAFTFKPKDAAENSPQLVIEYQLPEEPESPTPTEVIAPSPTSTPVDEAAVAEEASPTPALEPSPTPEEESPEATEEAEEKEGMVLSLTTGQAVIGGLILLALLGALIAFIFYFQQSSKKSEKSAKKSKKERGEKNEEE
jgi:hypothetical protein